MEANRAIVLYSGGVDSFASLLWALDSYDRVEALHFDLNCRNSTQQRKAVEVTVKELMKDYSNLSLIVSEALRFLGQFEASDYTVPVRNTLLILKATEFGEGDIILQNVQVGETSLMDRTREHNLVLEHFTGRRIISPFENFTKTEIVAWILFRHPKYLPLLSKTHSCFTDIEGGCWNCPACFRRWVSFKLNGVEIPFEGERKLLQSPLVEQYKNRAIAGYYGKRRGREILDALAKAGQG